MERTVAATAKYTDVYSLRKHLLKQTEGNLCLMGDQTYKQIIKRLIINYYNQGITSYS